MIRGAMLLTVGFTLGYVKALYDVPAIQDNLVTVIGLLKDEAEGRTERAKEANRDPRAAAARLREEAQRLEEEADNNDTPQGEPS